MCESEIFEVILKQRGVEDIDRFLNPIEADLLPLDSLKDIDKAYKILFSHLNKEIGVLYDVDVDGISAGTIAARYLWNITDKKKVHTFINNGKAHGLINQDISRFADVDLLIIVDSLDKNTSQYEKLKEMGIEVIVLDHHAVDDKVPYSEYITLVSSQLGYENPQLSGSGVVWKFCKYIDEQELTDYADELIDLAACGIIADMMDMTVMENRYIVNEGLKTIYNPAVKKIIGSFDFNSTAISFSIAPLINASCRMNENEAAMNLFLSDDNKEILKYKKALVACRERQNYEVERLFPSVLMQCEKQKEKKMIPVIIESEYGVSGLIAGKLLEQYQRPILVLKDCGDKLCGSMRAIGVSDFRKICNDSSFAEANGHELASGIEIDKNLFDDFSLYIEESLAMQEPDITELAADIQLDVSDITRGLIEQIKLIDKVAGEKFKPVQVYITNIEDYGISNMSNFKHLVVQPNNYLLVIKWNYSGSFEVYEDAAIMGDIVSCVCTLDSGFLGKKFVLKAVCNKIWIGGD